MGSSGPVDSASALRKLQAVTDATLAHLSVDELLDELLTRIREALDADTCAVLLLDESVNELVPRAAKGLEEEVERGVRVPVGRGFAGRIAAERRPLAIENVNHAEIINPVLREGGIKSLLGAPLIVGGRVLGVVHVGTLAQRRFDDEEMRLLEIVAQRAALALDRAMIHDELVRLSELQRDFIVLAAHELRAPATTVYGLAATLRERGGDLKRETIEELQTTMYEQAERMRRLVEQLLDLSRLDAATVQIKRERVPLRDHVERIVHSVAPDRTDDVRVAIPEDLVADVDPIAIERVVGNLLANALSYGTPPVTVSAAQTDRHVRIAVEDCGEGVAPEFVPFLFDPFRRSERSREQAGGTGLGLTIARSYAQALGGDLFYSSARPKGARFELVLPNQAA